MLHCLSLLPLLMAASATHGDDSPDFGPDVPDGPKVCTSTNEDDAFEGLSGAWKPVDKGTGAQELHERSEKLRVALLEVRGDNVRLNERLDKGLPGVQESLRKAKSEAGMEWSAAGDNALLRRFMLPDGGVQLGTVVEKVRAPGDKEDTEISVPGLFTSKAVSREHAEVVSAYAGYALSCRLFKRFGQSSVRKMRAKAWRNLCVATRALPGEVGATAYRTLTDPELRERAVNSTTTTGGYVINQPTISELRTPAALARRLPGLFMSQGAESSQFYQPTVSGRALSRKRGVTNEDPQRYRTSSPTWGRESLSLTDHQVTVLIDPLWLADFGNVLSDPIGFIHNYIGQAKADTLEFAMLHADTAGTHQDTLSTWTLGGYLAAGQMSGTDSMMTAWIGLRARAFDDSKTSDCSGTFDAADHAAALAGLGVHAAKAVMLVGLRGYYTQLIANSLFTTVNSFGALATLQTGQIAAVGDTPVIITEGLQAEYASTGLYTGSGTTNEFVYVDPTAWVLYDMAGSDFDEERPEEGARFVGSVSRNTFVPNVVSTETPVFILRNL